MASVSWYHERLDEMCARVQAEATSQADRIIEEMDTFEDYTWREQREHFRRWGQWGPERRPFSNWEIRRVIFPRLMAELDALI